MMEFISGAVGLALIVMVGGFVLQVAFGAFALIVAGLMSLFAGEE